MDGRKGVLEKITEKCRSAYLAKTPLIMIDTEELELVEEAALASGNIEPPEPLDGPLDGYYAFLDGGRDGLPRHRGWIKSDPAALTALAAGAGRDDSPERTIAAQFIVHLTGSAGKKGLSREEQQRLDALRAYTDAYLRCREDDSTALRCSCVLLYGDVSLLPEDLKPFTEVIPVEFPEGWEILRLVEDMVSGMGIPADRQSGCGEVARELSGFSLMQARRHVRRLLTNKSSRGDLLFFDPERRAGALLEAKKQSLLQNGGLLELVENKSPAEDGGPDDQDRLGGMGAYTRWVERNRPRVLDADAFLLERGVPTLKGVLLCGVPGCGKSEAAKILQKTWSRADGGPPGEGDRPRRGWDIPMLKMSVDQLMGGLVGDSERNMRRALKQAEAMSPCILWIDELDKGFSGSSSKGGNNSSDTFKRMFAYFLTWMQENRRPVFIFATANDISQLPGELFRSGRFDETFSVFMPTHDECVEIFREQMRRAARRRRDKAQEMGLPLENPKLFDDGPKGCFDDAVLRRIMELLVRQEKFVNGADIEKIVTSALARMDRPKGPVKVDDWERAVREVILDPSFSAYGEGSGSLDAITACYVRLLRGSFVPAALPEQVLLKQSEYRRELGRNADGSLFPVIRYEPVPSSAEAERPGYDRALHRAIASRIEWIGTELERRELKRL